MFEPANDIFVGYALETGNVTESTDGITPGTIATLPTSFALCGKLSNTPDVKRGLNNSFGFYVGSSQAAAKKRGARNPEMSMALKVTNIGILGQAIRDPTTKQLPRLAIVFGRPGMWTLCVRDAKINTLALKGTQNTTGEATEIEASISIMACYVHMLTTPLNPTAGLLLRALGDSFYWHDCRNFLVTGGDGTATDFRRTMTSWSTNLNNSLIRKGLRQNFGDNSVLSNTNEFLHEGNEVVTGDIGFDGRLSEANLTGAKEAQNWGDITQLISNSPAVVTGGKGINLTMADCMPQDATMPGVESNAQLTSSIPYLARSLALSAAA